MKFTFKHYHRNSLYFRVLQFFLFFAITAWGQQERIAIIQTMDDRDSIGISDLAYLTDRLRETAVKVLPKQRYGVMTSESIVAFLGSQERAAKNGQEWVAENAHLLSSFRCCQFAFFKPFCNVIV